MQTMFGIEMTLLDCLYTGAMLGKGTGESMSVNCCGMALSMNCNFHAFHSRCSAAPLSRLCSSFTTVHQSGLGCQVAALMRDPVRARARSQLLRAQALRPLCQPSSDLDSVLPVTQHF